MPLSFFFFFFFLSLLLLCSFPRPPLIPARRRRADDFWTCSFPPFLCFSPPSAGQHDTSRPVNDRLPQSHLLFPSVIRHASQQQQQHHHLHHYLPAPLPRMVLAGRLCLDYFFRVPGSCLDQPAIPPPPPGCRCSWPCTRPGCHARGSTWPLPESVESLHPHTLRRLRGEMGEEIRAERQKGKEKRKKKRKKREKSQIHTTTESNNHHPPHHVDTTQCTTEPRIPSSDSPPPLLTSSCSSPRAQG